MASRDLQPFIDELADWAATNGSRPQTYRYGSAPEQEADLYLPDGPGEHPVAVLLHGGFWRARFTRTLMSALAVDLVRSGWVAWNVEYRRVGNGGGVPATIDDVRAAIDALPAAEVPLDRSRLLVIGHSAGGQLALCVAARESVAGVVSLAGVCDLESGLRERIGQDAVREFMDGTSSERPDAYAVADPLCSITERRERPARARGRR